MFKKILNYFYLFNLYLAFYSLMDMYKKSYYPCNEVMMGLTIFSNYMGNNNAELI